MSHSRRGLSGLLRIIEGLYLFLIAFSFYLLLLSRSGEAYTVWEVMHPALVPMLVVATSFLLVVLLSSEKLEYKLLLVIGHSVLTHSFFSIIFPAGDLSGQQMALGRIRLIYDNAVLHGLPLPPIETSDSLIIKRLGGINFQAALSVVFARMFSIDIFWVHLFLVPVLWGIFTPIAAYLTTYTFTQNEKAAVLSSLLFTAFPYATYFGAISVPNSLGFIFFFFSLYFMLKYLSSNDSKTIFLMLTFSFFSFFSHDLTGIISVSLLLLAVAFKVYKSQEKTSFTTARFSLTLSLIVSVILLPLSLIYLRFFRQNIQTAFTLNKFYELPLQEIVGLLLIGELTYGFDLRTIVLFIIGPAIAFLCMMYLMYQLQKNPDAKFRTHIYFLLAAFIIILIDYRILKLFMYGLPFNEERLWVFRDFIAVSFVALAIYAIVSSLKSFLKAESLPTTFIANFKVVSKRNVLRFIGLLFILNVVIPLVVGGWVTVALRVAYPQVAPLQTTWYELDVVKYIEESTREKYVVIGDIWTIFAGEMIVGVSNPRAYYFAEYDKTGNDLFVKMRQDPSPQWMLLAMNYTNTTVAYFMVTRPRLGNEEFQNVVSRALQNQQLTVISVPGVPLEKLYVFSYRKE